MGLACFAFLFLLPFTHKLLLGFVSFLLLSAILLFLCYCCSFTGLTSLNCLMPLQQQPHNSCNELKSKTAKVAVRTAKERVNKGCQGVNAGCCLLCQISSLMCFNTAGIPDIHQPESHNNAKQRCSVETLFRVFVQEREKKKVQFFYNS